MALKKLALLKQPGGRAVFPSQERSSLAQVGDGICPVCRKALRDASSVTVEQKCAGL